MKRTIFATITAALLLVACTKEVPVYKEYQSSAETTPSSETEYVAMYCNLHDADASLDLNTLAEYVLGHKPDILLLSGKDDSTERLLKAWAEQIATSLGQECSTAFTCYTLDANDNLLAIVSRGTSNAFTTLKDETTATSAIYAQYGESYILLSALAEGTTQLDNETRQAQASYLVNQTIDNPSLDGSKWIWAIDMKSPSEVDNQKYGMDHDPNDTRANYLLKYNGMIDCLAAQSSSYPTTDVNGKRHNFVYATNLGWQMMSPLTLDTEAATLLGITNYPIIFTLKSE